MRIVVLLTDLLDTIGGIQSFNRSLVKALDEIAAERGWDVRVLALNDSSFRIHHEGFAGDRVRFSWRAVAEERKADVVFWGHVHFAPLMCFSNGARQFLVVHGIDAWKRLSPMQRWGTSRAERILSVSGYTRDRMAECNGLNPERFSILPNTVPVSFASGDVRRAELGLPEGKMILSVARLAATERAKGIDLVIQALPAVLQKVPDAFSVVIGDGEDRSRLEALATELGVSGKVRFVGRVPADRLPRYYAACDVFALPSTKEGFGIVFLEAMSHGKPCVGARVGGVPEVIEDGKTGFLVEPNDMVGLHDAFQALLCDKPLCERLGQAGRKRVEREFSFARFRERLEGLVRRAN